MGTIDGGGDLSNRWTTRDVGPGLRQDTASCCECGHWSSAHRNGGRKTCEGRRCGCYTFRQVTEATATDKSPKCPKCGLVLLCKTVTESQRRMELKLIVTWVHVNGSAPCVTFEAIMIDEEERIRQAAKTMLVEYLDEDEGFTLDDPVGAKASSRRLTDAELREEATKPFNGLKIDEWELDLARSRAERNVPQRAPIALNEEDHV